MSFFVDCHSHVVPSGDDGAGSLGEARALCRDAARHGTAVLFATPHVWPHLRLTEARAREVRAAYEQLKAGAGLDLRLGFELTPSSALLDDDPWRYELEGTGRVLMEVPFQGDLDVLVALAERAQAAGLAPVIAHPERTAAVLEEPALADWLASRGWTLQVNASSLLGRHGESPQELGWDYVERGVARVVASDGHRDGRPARLDAAWEAALERIGEARARPLFDGSALGLAAEPACRAAAGA